MRNSEKLHCKRGHAFSEANTYVHPTSGSRHCRECRALGDRKRRASQSDVHNRDKTCCPYGHEYTPENTYVAPYNGQRMCRTCRSFRKRGVQPS